MKTHFRETFPDRQSASLHASSGEKQWDAAPDLADSQLPELSNEGENERREIEQLIDDGARAHSSHPPGAPATGRIIRKARRIPAGASAERRTMPAPSMQSTVAALVTPGKGILTADDSLPTMGQRFASLGIPLTEENRRAYRRALCTSPGLGKFISGAILFDETLRQKTGDKSSFAATLVKQGIIPGVQADQGTVALANFPGEKITRGLYGLRERLAVYRELGARFTNWRAVISIGDRFPTAACIEANAGPLAHFAALSQEAGLVPMVEVEVLADGNHTLRRCEEVMSITLQVIFAGLFAQRVALETMLLKTGLVLPGRDCLRQADAREVAAATLRCLRRAVPPEVAGIVFLPGGQSDIAATQQLNALCGMRGRPWRLSFSFDRALQNAAMTAWGGSPANVTAAQIALLHRARCNSLAAEGRYSARAERAETSVCLDSNQPQRNLAVPATNNP
jgi:fructose-bisphosphate aldolase class I